MIQKLDKSKRMLIWIMIVSVAELVILFSGAVFSDGSVSFTTALVLIICTPIAYLALYFVWVPAREDEYIHIRRTGDEYSVTIVCNDMIQEAYGFESYQEAYLRGTLILSEFIDQEP